MTRTTGVVADHVDLAREIFTSNLVFAFVGGSHAEGRARPDSDVDVFILLHRPDRAAEIRFARQMGILHDRHGLVLDHYGEIFDRATLDALLDFTDQLGSRWSSAVDSPCYRGNCSLSAFRKGQVVARFLTGQRTSVYNPAGELARYERIARVFLGRAGLFPLPPAANVVDFGDRRDLAELAARVGGSGKHPDDLLDTAVGVGLERWFGADVVDRARLTLATSTSSIPATKPTTGLRCPLQSNRSALSEPFESHQCLGAGLSPTPIDPQDRRAAAQPMGRNQR